MLPDFLHIQWILPYVSRGILFLLLLFTVPSNTVAQQYITNLQTFGADQGLADRNINCYFKDSRGFLWLGTDYELVRFDGYTFKRFTEQEHDFQSQNIVQITEDEQGMLWLLYGKDNYSTAGIDIFNPYDESLQTFTKYSAQSLPPSKHPIINMVNTPEHGIILAFRNGDIFHYQGEQLKKWTSLHTEKVFYQCYPTADGGAWLMSRNTLVQLSKEGKVVNTITTPHHIQEIIGVNQTGLPIYTASSHPSGIQPRYLYEGSKQLSLLPEDGSHVLALDTTNQHLYIVGGRGPQFLRVYDLKGNLIEKHSKNYTLTHASLYYLNTELWYNAHQKGIALVQTHITPFEKFLHDHPIDIHRSYGARGMHLFTDKQLLVSGIDNSFQVDLTNYQYTPFATEVAPFYKIWNRALEQGLAIFQDHEGAIWFSDELYRLIKYDTARRTFENFSYTGEYLEELVNIDIGQASSSPPFMQWSLCEDDDHTVWIGTRYGLSYFNRKKGYVQRYNQYTGFEELSKSNIYHFHKSKQGLWLATSSGLYLFDPNKGIQARFHELGDSTHQIPHNHIAHIYEDTTGVFWLASKGGGLIKWHPETKDTQQFTVAEGLSHDVIYAVYEDDYGYLWMSSNMGIMRFNKQTHEINTYLPKDGLSHHEFNTISHLQTPDGQIYFGSVNGITSFHPKSFITKGSETYPLEVTEITKQDQESGNFIDVFNDWHQSDEVVLKATDLGLRLDFAYLNFQPNKVRYAYKLDRLDNNWTYIQQPTIRINRLPYGKHKLLIKAQGQLGIWGQPKTVHITQQKPFYFHFWFIVLCLATVTLGVWQYIQYRTRRYQREQERLESVIDERTTVIVQQTKELQRLDQLKSKFFANISHELRTPLTLMLAPVKELLKYPTDKRQHQLLSYVKENGEHLQSMINGLLNLSKLEAEKLELTLIPTSLDAFLKQFFANFDSLAQHQQIQYRYQLELEGHLQVLVDQEKVQTILSNLLSNAFKFTPAKGAITIQVLQKQLELSIIVQDTGIGIPQEDLPYIFERYYQSKNESRPAIGGSGIGLALAHELALLMQGSLVVNSQLGQGSTFTLSFPLEVTTLECQPFRQNIKQTTSTPSSVVLIPHSEPQTKAHILLVEDHKDMQEFITNLLQSHYEVTTSNNGKAALEWLETSTHLPDLIISDLMMPEMDGFTLLGHIKQHTVWRKLPVIMLTARADEANRLQALRIGIDDYLTKPFSTDELIVRIENLLSNYKERTKLHQLSSPTASVDENTVETAQVDLEWLQQIESSIKSQIGNTNFSLQDIAEQHHLSMRQFQRRVKKITGITPVQYQKEIQLHLAKAYLEKGAYRNVSEVSYAVGFRTPHYFSQLFIKRFGKKPSEYLVGSLIED